MNISHVHIVDGVYEMEYIFFVYKKFLNKCSIEEIVSKNYVEHYQYTIQELEKKNYQIIYTGPTSTNASNPEDEYLNINKETNQ